MACKRIDSELDPVIDSAYSSDARSFVTELGNELTGVGSPERAVGAKRYLKSDLSHLGVRVPDIRAATRALLRTRQVSGRDQVLDIAATLWAQPVFELRLASVEVLIASRAVLDDRDLSMCEVRLREAHTWALVDPLAIDVVGAIAADAPDNPVVTATLSRWVEEEHFWLPRAALLSQLRIVRSKDGDPSRFFSYADQLLEQREFFIAKAIGWVLRDMSRRHPELVFEWLLPRAHRCSAVTNKEAVKYLTDAQRQEVAAARAST